MVIWWDSTGWREPKECLVGERECLKAETSQGCGYWRLALELGGVGC